MTVTVVDTNAWVSAMQFRGVPFEALVKVLCEDTVACSSYIKDEVTRILSTKFDWELARIHADLSFYLRRSVWVETEGSVFPECRNPKDHPIIETALRAGASTIISGDKDLLALGVFHGIRILTARQYLEEPSGT